MIEQAYERNKRHIEITVKRMSDTSHFHPDDLLSEANWIFMKCWEKLKAGRVRVNFDTYFSRSLEKGLLSYMRKSRKRDHSEINNTEPSYVSSHESKIILEMTLSKLSDNAQICLRIIFDRREKFETVSDNWIHHTKKNFVSYVNRHKGIPYRKVNDALNEIKMAIA